VEACVPFPFYSFSFVEWTTVLKDMWWWVDSTQVLQSLLHRMVAQIKYFMYTGVFLYLKGFWEEFCNSEYRIYFPTGVFGLAFPSLISGFLNCWSVKSGSIHWMEFQSWWFLWCGQKEHIMLEIVPKVWETYLTSLWWIHGLT